MKITEVVCQILRIPNVRAKTASSQDSVLVRIRTDTGLEGVGEADSSPEVVKAIIDAPFSHNIACGLRQLLVGENPLENERLWQKMYRRTMYFGRTEIAAEARDPESGETRTVMLEFRSDAVPERREG